MSECMPSTAPEAIGSPVRADSPYDGPRGGRVTSVDDISVAVYEAALL